MKNLLSFIIVTVLLLVPVVAHGESYNYNQLHDYHDVSEIKRFTVKNEGFTRNEINTRNIYVLNENGYKMDIKVYPSTDKKSIVIQPSKRWISGRYYKVCIEYPDRIDTFDFYVKKYIYLAK